MRHSVRTAPCPALIAGKPFSLPQTPNRGRVSGKVAEWFKATVLKTVVGETLPWVRIPPFPPHYALRASCGRPHGVWAEARSPQGVVYSCLPKPWRREATRSQPLGGSAMWYVYFLELANDDIYVGSTSDLKARVPAHERGEVASTRPFRPLQLRSYAAVETETQARELERYFKTGSGKAIAKKRFLAR